MNNESTYSEFIKRIENEYGIGVAIVVTAISYVAIIGMILCGCMLAWHSYGFVGIWGVVLSFSVLAQMIFGDFYWGLLTYASFLVILAQIS